MPAMNIDVEAISQLGSDLSTVATEFDNANTNSAGVADSTGHARLAEVVRGFAQKWDDSRAKMATAVRSLSEAATQLAQVWRDLDQQGADAMSSEGQTA